MTDPGLWSPASVQFLVLGLATGSLSALVALGVVLTHRATGVLNFAAGAMGAVGAFVCYDLRDMHGAPTLVAVLVGLGTGALVGMLLHLALRFLRAASVLSKVVCTLGILSALQGLMVLRWGTTARQPQSVLPDDRWHVSSFTIGYDRVIIIALVLVLATALWLFFSRSLFGLATAAVAEDRQVAASSGWDTSRIELANHVISGVLAALAAILLAPIVSLNAAVLSMAVLPALAAALVGRFSSFGITVAAALVIGALQAEATLRIPQLADWLSQDPASLVGVPQAVPLLIILVTAVVTGTTRTQRGETHAALPVPGTGRVPTVPVAAAVLLIIIGLNSSSAWADAVVVTLGMALLVSSIVVVSGYAGQLSLCQLAIGGLGGLVAARQLSLHGWPLEYAVLLAVGLCVVAGVLLALPAIRTRGVTLAVVTLATALMLDALVFKNSAVSGGYVGLSITNLNVLGLSIDPILHPARYGAVALILLLLTGLVVSNLRRGRIGRRLLAVRSNERAAASLGIGVVGAKLFAFAVGAAAASLGGMVLALRLPNVQLDLFGVFGSVLLVQYAVIGGLGWVSGVAIGAAAAPGGLLSQILATVFPEAGDITPWLALASGIGVVQVLAQMPNGFAAWAADAAPRHTRWSTLPRRRPGASVGASLAAGTRHRGTPATLTGEGISVAFGNVQALHEVDISVQPGEVVGLMGPNGAGKTTLLDVLSGFTAPRNGQVLVDGTNVTRWSPERRARRGVKRSWQGVELFADLTVLENLLVAADQQERRAYLRDLMAPGKVAIDPWVWREVERLDLLDRLDDSAATLPAGTARVIGIARAVASNPRLLMLDEPAAGLDVAERAELALMVRRMADDLGVGVLVVEHDVELLSGMCDRVVVMDAGRVIANDAPSVVAADPVVVAAYLGTSAADPIPAPAPHASVAIDVTPGTAL